MEHCEVYVFLHESVVSVSELNILTQTSTQLVDYYIYKYLINMQNMQNIKIIPIEITSIII
jgi:hypothetical protein